MQASAAQGLAWIEYDRLWDGKSKRDDVAHEAKYVSQAEAKELVKLIQANLQAWGFTVKDLQ